MRRISGSRENDLRSIEKFVRAKKQQGVSITKISKTTGP